MVDGGGDGLTSAIVNCLIEFVPICVFVIHRQYIKAEKEVEPYLIELDRII